MQAAGFLIYTWITKFGKEVLNFVSFLISLSVCLFDSNKQTVHVIQLMK